MKNKRIKLILLLLSIITIILTFYFISNVTCKCNNKCNNKNNLNTKLDNSLIEGFCLKGCRRPNKLLTDTSSPDFSNSGVYNNQCTVIQNGVMNCPWVCGLKKNNSNSNKPTHDPTTMPDYEKNLQWVNKNLLPTSISNPDTYFSSISSGFKLLTSPFKNGLDSLTKKIDDSYQFNKDVEKLHGQCTVDNDCSSCTPHTILS